MDGPGPRVRLHGSRPPRPGLAGWRLEGNTTQSTADVAFPDSVPGGVTVWPTAYHYNTRAHSGPARNPAGAAVPGGAVSTAA